ncbi:XrtA/PEP-CTERM system histidine kinase PrsK [Chromatocurvus halotolerans]|uniref:histidine kinase n=1 Tax=Chromatocurvus halotolerans TaxID=1132028 RepID=A0A4R2KKY5_9GAMM|nr:XrtA/PEP-CTERM system histidine kinase PrsK [Chromatocurvus halotolerans]TCO74333.1 signal transduction histidine kinase [Chromatocurvus halotolerans]
MPSNISLLTYGLAGLAFALISVLLLFRWRIKPLGPSLTLACGTTAAWALSIALGTLPDYPPLRLIRVMELLRNGAWLFFLLQLLSLQHGDSSWRWHGRQWLRPFLPLMLLVLALQLAPTLPPGLLSRALLAQHHDLMLSVWLVLAIAGLVLIEQLYRNAASGERWSLKFLCLGLGALYTYDFFMYAEALLFRQLDAQLWQARGLVAALVTPWLAIGIARNTQWRMDLHVSRHVVFHTVTLMGTGLYLLGMAVIGYFIKYLGGTWSGVLQVGFLAASGALLVSLLFSGKLRARLRVFLSKHFFSYRYDYRDEWLKFTRALASLSGDVAEGIIRTMAPLVSGRAGLLFSTPPGDTPRLLAHWQMPPPQGCREGLGNLPAWVAKSDWVVDLRERRQSPDLYEGLVLPEWLERTGDLWLIIPLVFGERLEGLLMLKGSDFKHSLNWEDRDLLKTAGRQAASHLAQHLASQALVEARQFDAFNRLSAYVVHDLKNILAQQSLIVSNAARHRDNPAFIDDMIATVENSVTRMQRLMEQMRSGVRSGSAELVSVAPLLAEVIAQRASTQPAPIAELNPAASCIVEADRERLATVFTHLVQNAQEATDSEGEVRVRLDDCDEQRVSIDIIDTGRGMDEDFLRTRLFRPFESTKGLTGMGIGVFESREYIRQLGGDIDVESTPGKGTCFTVQLPVGQPNALKDT